MNERRFGPYLINAVQNHGVFGDEFCGVVLVHKILNTGHCTARIDERDAIL